MSNDYSVSLNALFCVIKCWFQLCYWLVVHYVFTMISETPREAVTDTCKSLNHQPFGGKGDCMTVSFKQTLWLSWLLFLCIHINLDYFKTLVMFAVCKHIHMFYFLVWTFKLFFNKFFMVIYSSLTITSWWP